MSNLPKNDCQHNKTYIDRNKPNISLANHYHRFKIYFLYQGIIVGKNYKNSLNQLHNNTHFCLL